jgi:hypothetical protein
MLLVPAALLEVAAATAYSVYVAPLLKRRVIDQEPFDAVVVEETRATPLPLRQYTEMRIPPRCGSTLPEKR